MSGTFFDMLCLIMTGLVIDYLLFTIYYFICVYLCSSAVRLNNCGALGSRDRL